MEFSGGPKHEHTSRRDIVRDATVEVLVDDTGRLGTLSYVRPPGVSCRIGDAVRVPFGASERYGFVVGQGDATKATREILECFGPRTGAAEIALAAELANEHIAPFAAIAPRLAPRSRRGNPPLDAGPVVRTGPVPVQLGYDGSCEYVRRLLVAPPTMSLHQLAAIEAERLAAGHQVLVLCPTRKDVELIAGQFTSGAARLDQVPDADAPSAWQGFVHGSVRIAVATRAAALWSAATPPAIVVLDEGHPGHVEAAGPYTNARDIAIQRTARAGTPLSLCTHLPSMHALAAKVRLIQVGSSSDWPRAHVVSRTNLPPFDRLAPPAALADVSAARRNKRHAYVLAPSSTTKFRCKSCKLEHVSAKAPCTRCGLEVRPYGLGPDRVAQLFPKATPLTFAELFASKPRDGSTVVVLDTDRLATAEDLAPERTLATVLVAAARLAGPSGTVCVVVDDDPPAACVDLLLRHDVRRFCTRVWALAKEAELPPFVKMVTVRHRRATPPKVPRFDGVRVLGPQRVGDEYVTTFLAPLTSSQALVSWLASVKKSGKARIVVQ